MTRPSTGDRLRAAARRVRYRAASLTASVNERPILVVGLQKSGTSAITALLAESCGLTAVVDIKPEITRQLIYRVQAGDASIDDLVDTYRVEFSRDVIKHPNFVLVYPQLRERFPQARFVLVVRDPRDNVRSILDRLDLPGDVADLTVDQWSGLSIAWRRILGGAGLDGPPGTYIENLARRWNLAARPVVGHPGAVRLVRYEEFIADKPRTLRELAADLGLQPVHDVSKRLDVQFQPAGARRGVPWPDFFGTANLSRIEALCGDGMQALGYR